MAVENHGRLYQAEYQRDDDNDKAGTSVPSASVPGEVRLKMS